MPFSDPLSDWPTIQASSQLALNNSINLTDVFRLVRDLRKNTELPIVLFTYYNHMQAHSEPSILSTGKKQLERSLGTTLKG